MTLLRARCLILTVVFTIGLASNSFTHELQQVTLRTAVERALSRVPELRIARQKIFEADAQISQSYSALFPSVGTSLAYSYRKDPLNLGNPAFGGESYNFYDFRVAFTQPIYQGSILPGINLVTQEKEVRGWDSEIVERDTTLRVIEAFYAVLLCDTRLRTLNEQEQAQKDLLKIAQDRFRTGRSRRLEVLQVQTQLALLLPKIQGARNQLELAAAGLGTLLGETEAARIQVIGSFAAPDWKKIETDPRKGKDRIPELQRNEKLQEQVVSRRGVTLAKHFPQLNALGYWGHSAYVRKELLDEFSTNWNVGIQLQIPLFSGLSSVFERRQIASQQAQAELEQVRLQDQFSLSQIQTQKNLELAQAQTAASETALKLATEAIKLAKMDYRLGMTDYLQLFDAEQRYVDAEFGYDQARNDVLVAEARAFVARGWLLKDFVNQVSDLKP